MKIKTLLLTLLAVLSGSITNAATDYKNDADYLALRDSMHHAFNDGDSKRFDIAVKKLEDYLLAKDDLHAYYTQRCNEIVFRLNRQQIFEAYKLAQKLSKELRERKLDKEMYMAVNMMGHLNRYCGNKETAKRCFYEVIDMMEKEGYYESMPPIFMNIVNVEMGDNPEEALRLLDKAKEISAKYSPDRVFDIETRKTLSYYSQGDTERFLAGYKDYKKGVEEGKSSVHGRTMEVYYLALQGQTDKAVDMARKELGDESSDVVSLIYEKAGRWQDAYQSLKQATAASDSINNVVLSNSMAGIQDELSLYEAERQAARNRTVMLVAVISLLLLLVAALTYIVVARRRHVRQLSNAYEHALESDKTKTAFIQNVTHEIRTPLNIVAGFSQVIADPEQEITIEERKYIAQMMKKNTQQMTTLIDEMLELSVNENSGMVSREDESQLNQLLRGLLHDYEDEAGQHTQLKLETSLPDNYRMKTNEVMLKRIVNSLLSNAVKNTQQGSVTLRAAADEAELTITVEDTGCGVPAKDAERIFERFVKLDTFKEGLGLGLPLCRTLARRLGGNVRLDTSYSPGARFVVTLPV